MIDYMQVYTAARGAEVVGELWTGNVTGRPCVARNMKVCSRAGLAEHGFTEHHVHAKGLAVGLSGEPARYPAPRGLEPGEQLVGHTHHPQVNVLRRPGAVQTQFQHEAALQHDRVPELGHGAREEPVEHQQLALPSKGFTTLGCVPQALFERLLEAKGGGIGTGCHTPMPPNGARALATAPRSPRAASPRRRA